MPHFRVEALRRLHGWDAWNVTEDADLGLRLARFGYRVETIASTTHEEAPARLAPWLKQRRRWIKGWMQTILVLGRDPQRLVREVGVWRAAASLALLANGVLGPMLAPAFALLFIYDAVWGDLLAPDGARAIVASTFWLCLAIGGVAASLGQALLGVRRRNLYREARFLPLLPLYHLLLAAAGWCALVDLWRNPYAWAKTSHGHAKTSRRRWGVNPAPDAKDRRLRRPS